MKAIVQAAGCHRFTDGFDPIAFNGKFLAVHTGSGGAKTIHLPRPASMAVELLSGRKIPVSGRSFVDEFASPDTKLYKLEP